MPIWHGTWVGRDLRGKVAPKEVEGAESLLILEGAGKQPRANMIGKWKSEGETQMGNGKRSKGTLETGRRGP